MKRWRRRIVWFLVVVSLALACVGAAAAFLGPRFVRERVERVASSRLGMRATVQHVGLGLRGVVLGGVSLVPEEGGGIALTLDEVSASGAWLDLLLHGSSGIRVIRATGGLVAIDAGAQGFDDALRTIRASLARRTATETAARVERALFVDALQLNVRDADGDLLSAQGLGLEYASGRAQAQMAHARLGAAPGDEAALDGVSAVLTKHGGAWRVERAAATRVDGIWAARGPATNEASRGQASTATRVRALVAALRDEGPEPALGAVHERNRPAQSDGQDANGPPSDVARRAANALKLNGIQSLLRLAPGGTMALTQAKVRVRGGDVLLEDFTLSLEARESDRLRARGAGRTPTGGQLRWDLKLAPRDATVEGTVSFEQLPLALVAPLLPDLPLHEPERTRLDGELSAHPMTGDAYAIDGRARVSQLGLAGARIAPSPIRGIDLTIEGTGTWHPTRRRLDVARAFVEMGHARIALHGALERTRDHYVIDLHASMPVTACNDAIGALPRDLLQDVAGFTMSGTMGGRIDAFIDSRDFDATRLTIDVSDGCAFESVPGIADLRRFEQPFVHRVTEPDGTVFEMTTGPGTANWVPLRDVSPFIVHAVLGHEDGGFFGHHGFAPTEIRTALVRNLKAGRYVQGASTITMQLVKNIFLRREKTLARKFQEAVLTWWIERAMPKHRILELYLNVIEFGPHIYGIRNACEHYFGRSASEISVGEAAFLATILPNPKVFHASYDRGELSPGTASRMRTFLAILAARGRIDAAALDDGLREVAAFRFHHDGDPPPAERPLVGSTRAIAPDSTGYRWELVGGVPGAQTEAPDATAEGADVDDGTQESWGESDYTGDVPRE